MDKIKGTRLAVYPSDTWLVELKKFEDLEGWFIYDYNDEEDGTEPAFYLTINNGKKRNYGITLGKSALQFMLSEITSREKPKPENIAYGSEDQVLVAGKKAPFFADPARVQSCCPEGGCCQD